MQRHTRIDAKPIETILDIDSDQLFDYPFLLAISAGDWELTPEQAARLRKYFDCSGIERGGTYPHWRALSIHRAV